MTKKTKLFALISAGLFALMMVFSIIPLITDGIQMISDMIECFEEDFAKYYLYIFAGSLAAFIGAVISTLVYFGYTAVTLLSVKTGKPLAATMSLVALVSAVNAIGGFFAAIPSKDHFGLFFWDDLLDFSLTDFLDRYWEIVFTPNMVVQFLLLVLTEGLFLLAMLAFLATIRISSLHSFTRLSWLLPSAVRVINPAIRWIYCLIMQFIYMFNDDIAYGVLDVLEAGAVSLWQLFPLALSLVIFASMGFWMMKWVEDTQKKTKPAPATAPAAESPTE